MLRLPALIEGETYAIDRVRPFVAEDDLGLVVSGFPKDLDRWPHEDLLQYRGDEPILFEYKIIRLVVLEDQITEFYKTFQEDAEHRDRIDRIASRLRQGDPVFPVFIQKNDPKQRITEGMHRAVAIWLLGEQEVPVLLTKYADW